MAPVGLRKDLSVLPGTDHSNGDARVKRKKPPAFPSETVNPET
jgi:hypothetical protein